MILAYQRGNPTNLDRLNPMNHVGMAGMADGVGPDIPDVALATNTTTATN